MERIKTYIDLFAGCGGLSLGLYNAGWKGLFAIEKSPQAFKTLEFNLIEKTNHFLWPKWLPIQAHDIKYSQVVTTALKEMGYNVYGDLVNFGDYGIPQKRIRFILVGIRDDVEGSNCLTLEELRYG